METRDDAATLLSMVKVNGDGNAVLYSTVVIYRFCFNMEAVDRRGIRRATVPLVINSEQGYIGPIYILNTIIICTTKIM